MASAHVGRIRSRYVIPEQVVVYVCINYVCACWETEKITKKRKKGCTLI